MITADGSDDNLIHLDGVEEECSFMDADSTPEPSGDVLPASPAPAEEEHPSGSGDEEDDPDEGVGESNSGANGELATLEVDDNLGEDEEPLPLEITHGVRSGKLCTRGTRREFVKRPIVLR